jgi:hypothetical protein
LKDPKNRIEGFRDRVLYAGTPDQINIDDKRLIDLCEKSLGVANEILPDVNVYNLNYTQISEVIFEMRERGHLNGR